jgi:hypothetical protein
MKDKDGEYEVGYGKPPRGTRFRNGQSGNPSGRPKGSANTTTLLQRALNESVVIKENGRRKKITKREAMFKQLVNKAASGHPRLIQLLLAALRDIEVNGRPPETKDQAYIRAAVRKLSIEEREEYVGLLRRAFALQERAVEIFEGRLTPVSSPPEEEVV